MKLLTLLLGVALLVMQTSCVAALGEPIDDVVTVFTTITSSCTDSLSMSGHVISSTVSHGQSSSVSPVQSSSTTHIQPSSISCTEVTTSVVIFSTVTPIVTVHASSLVSADTGHASTTTMYTTITPATTLTSERPTTTNIVHDTVTTSLTLLTTASATSPACDGLSCMSGLTPAVHPNTCLHDIICGGTQVSAHATSTMTFHPPFYNFTDISPHATNLVGSSTNHNTTWSVMPSYPIPLVNGTNSNTLVPTTTSNLPILPSLVTQTSVVVVPPTGQASSSGPSVSIPLPLTRASSSTSTATSTAVSRALSTRQIPRLFLVLSQLIKTLQAEAEQVNNMKKEDTMTISGTAAADQTPTSTVTDEHTSTTTVHPSTVTITASTPAQTEEKSVANVFTSGSLILIGLGLVYVWVYL